MHFYNGSWHSSPPNDAQAKNDLRQKSDPEPLREYSRLRAAGETPADAHEKATEETTDND